METKRMNPKPSVRPGKNLPKRESPLPHRSAAGRGRDLSDGYAARNRRSSPARMESPDSPDMATLPQPAARDRMEKNRTRKALEIMRRFPLSRVMRAQGFRVVPRVLAQGAVPSGSGNSASRDRPGVGACPYKSVLPTWRKSE